MLVDETGMIIAGHGRIEAAKKLGLAEEPVMVAAEWSEAKKRAYVIADNKLALNAGWNEELLAAELTDLAELAFDLDLIGFDAPELERLLGSADAVDGEDEVPDVPEQPVSRQGDLWHLGRHRLLCGDATSGLGYVLSGLSRAHSGNHRKGGILPRGSSCQDRKGPRTAPCRPRSGYPSPRGGSRG